MRVEIRARQFSLTDALHDYVEKRLTSALAGQAGHVTNASVLLSDENGPKGGEDKVAHVTATVAGRAVVIEDRDANMYAAIDRAMDRLQESARRKITRQHDRARGVA